MSRSKGKGGARKVYSYAASEGVVFVIARSIKASIAILHDHGFAQANKHNISETDRDRKTAREAINFKAQELGS